MDARDARTRVAIHRHMFRLIISPRVPLDFRGKLQLIFTFIHFTRAVVLEKILAYSTRHPHKLFFSFFQCAYRNEKQPFLGKKRRQEIYFSQILLYQGLEKSYNSDSAPKR
jgi:hypothetical protein